MAKQVDEEGRVLTSVHFTGSQACPQVSCTDTDTDTDNRANPPQDGAVVPKKLTDCSRNGAFIATGDCLFIQHS
jgi:hypothetical protein